MRNKSNKIAKLERNRKSILTEDLTRCYLCGMPKHHLHEVFFGRNRQLSMKYGCVVPLCTNCHNKVHLDHSTDIKLKKECKKVFKKYYKVDEEGFIKIFRNSYEK